MERQKKQEEKEKEMAAKKLERQKIKEEKERIKQLEKEEKQKMKEEKKRQKEHQALISALSKGDEVVLTSGLLGRITDLDDEYITINSGSVEQRYQRFAVHAVLPKGTLKAIE